MRVTHFDEVRLSIAIRAEDVLQQDFLTRHHLMAEVPMCKSSKRGYFIDGMCIVSMLYPECQRVSTYFALQ
jgi:hypothetical protein